MNWQPYPKYKESSVQWLGKVPEHWKKLQLSKCINAIKDGTHGTFERIPSDYTLLSAKNVTDKGIITGEYESSISEKDYKSITANGFPRKYDILITIVGTIGRACVFIEEKPIAFQRSVAFLRLNNQQEPRYFSYQICSKPFQEQLVVRTKSAAQGGVYMGDLVKIPVLAPLLYEQTAIADFLDRETGRIDTLVAKNKKLIELLKEERSALISRTVTRGLPEDAAIEYGLEPHTRFKDSGVEWLGEVPEGWEVKRLKYSASINDEILPETTKPDFDFLYVDIGSVTLLEGIIRKESMTFEDAPSRARRKARAGDAIVSTVRTYLRAIASIPETDDVLIVSTGFAVIRSRLLCPRYLGYALKESSFVEQVVARSVGVSYPAVNASEIGDIAIPLPSENEQTAIADFLDCETGRIDNLIGKVEALITRLQEYRIAIITDAVTGKIDVREMAA